MVWTNQRLETLVKKKRLIASVQTTRFTGGYDLLELACVQPVIVFMCFH